MFAEKNTYDIQTYVPRSGSEGGLVIVVVGVEVEAMGMVTSAAQKI